MPSRRLMAISWPAVGLTILIASCFHSVLFQGHQFGYRDSGYYYYPLHQRTAQQWKSGQLPLWDPSENGGMSLLGNPTAAVLYPGKIVFAILPYAWAARVYLMGHVLMAFVAMIVMLRGLGIGGTGATLGGLSYAFSGPVLFQYCNAIYLVGAAWLPLGFLAVDSWLRQGRRWSAVWLAVVLAMQSLGGDLQSSYVLGFFAAMYAIWLNRFRSIAIIHLIIVAATWFVGTLLVAYWLPGWRDWGVSSDVLVWINRIGRLGAIAAILVLVFRWIRSPYHNVSRSLFGLAAAAAVGIALAGVQMAPVVEMAAHSVRMSGDKAMHITQFSVEPYRLLELVWPGFFGVELPENRLWMLAIPPAPGPALWSVSLYAGVFTLVLAIAGLRSSAAPSWRGPIAAMGLCALVLAMGRFAGPLWWIRCVPGASAIFGPHDSGGASVFRPGDGQVRDAFASPYVLLAWLAPGFSGFRYPAKFFTFATLAFSALAAFGWDGLARGSSRAAIRTVGVVIASCMLGLVLTLVFQRPILLWFEASAKVASIAGRLIPAGALFEIRRAFLHAAIVALASGIIVITAAKNRKFAAVAAILLMAIDLSVANSRLIWTTPQSEFDKVPLAVKTMVDADAKSPQAGPYRIHRMPLWRPVDWIQRTSPDRIREVVSWEHDSIQAGYGSINGVEYVMCPGNVEASAFDQLVDPFQIIPDAEGARMIHGQDGEPMYYFPRRTFDMWGARYFILPCNANEYSSPANAIAAFFFVDVKKLFPASDEPAVDPSTKREEWMIYRNLNAYPRSWVVHEAHVRQTLPDGAETPEAKSWRTSIMYSPDPFWRIEGRTPENPRQVAWIETENPLTRPLDLQVPPDPAAESVVVDRYEPARVELTAKLEAPGLVVLADAFDSGWKLTLDGKPATILRANHMMRAVAVGAGTHRLIYTYEPFSLKLGLMLSAAGVVGLIALGFLKPPQHEEAAGWEALKPSTTPPTSA